MQDEVELIMAGERGAQEEAEELDTQNTESAEETKKEEAEEKENKNSDKEEEEKATKEEVKKDKNIQALDSERARRKNAEKKIKELQAENEKLKSKYSEDEKVKNEKENLKKKLMQDDIMDEDIADRLISTLGEDLIKQKVRNEKEERDASFEKEFDELTKDEMFYDAEEYKEEIRALMTKGLSAKSAYFAIAGENKISSIKKELEVEIEQKLLNKANKTEKIDVGHEEAKGEQNREKYSKKEQEYANKLGIDVKDVHKRLGAMTLDEIMNL